ncbi:MAG: nucleotidyltransferase domain-containing protein [Candidatus Woesearchaeota archaeon]|nr:nucleotidyltransferase domain-containing protein [Candidatus Woesearchaeota archaeon]
MKTLQGEEVSLNEAYEKTLTWFFSYPTIAMSLSDLVEEIDVSKTTANKIVTQLVAEDFLRKEILGRTWRITCNQHHPYNTKKKIPHNLHAIYASNIVDFVRDAVPHAQAIILFGSYRKGDDTEKSDIDIAVEVADNNSVEIVKIGVLEKIGYRKNIDINVHIFSRNNIDLNLFASIANGIVLDGFLEVRP